MEPELIDDGPRPAVRVVRHYDHPVDRVWRAVTTPEHLSAWFPGTVEIDLRPGGAMSFSHGPTGAVLEVAAPHHLAFTWGDDRLDFDLQDDAGGTRFTLTHTIDDRAGAASFAAGWEGCLGALASVLAGTPPVPAGRREQRHEELAARFGLDRPVVTRSGDGWTARWERQLVCPPTVAWEVFFGGVPAPDGHEFLLALRPGTGHGARLVLELRSAADSADLERWGDRAVAHVAAEALRRVRA